MDMVFISYYLKLHLFRAVGQGLTYLIDGVFSLFTVHLGDVNDFHNVGVTVGHRLHLDGVAKAAFSDPL